MLQQSYSHPNRFQKRERLKGKKPIAQLFSSGSSKLIFPLKITYVISKEPADHNMNASFSPGVRIAVGTSKRLFKKAVDRNKCKRLLREAYRNNKRMLTNLAMDKKISVNLFVHLIGKSVPDFQTIENKTNSILKFLEIKINELPANEEITH